MSDIIATSPIVNLGEGCAATRIVLRRMKGGGEYVIHNQRFYEDGSTGFDHGNYVVNESRKSIVRAWGYFTDRSHKLLEDNPLFNLTVDPQRFTSLLERGGQGR